MIDRMQRDHVKNVRLRKDRYYVVMTDKDKRDEWEITWEQWLLDREDIINGR